MLQLSTCSWFCKHEYFRVICMACSIYKRMSCLISSPDLRLPCLRGVKILSSFLFRFVYAPGRELALGPFFPAIKCKLNSLQFHSQRHPKIIRWFNSRIGTFSWVSPFNLWNMMQEAPCGDFVTHFFCHFCAICQEYREIRERAGGSGSHDLNLAVVTPPTTQTMESNPEK